MNLFQLRIKKIMLAVRSKLGRKALLHGVAASFEHGEAFGRTEFATVVDIGANKGQFSLLMRNLFPNAEIHSFEPLESCGVVFRKIFGRDSKVILHSFAVGAQSERSEMFVTEHDDSSSLLVPGINQETVFGTRIARRTLVSVEPLDRLISRHQIRSPALLKLDVQGYELDALRGCTSLLDCFDEVYAEVSYLELYVGQALANEIIDFLGKHDFLLCGVFNQHVDLEKGPTQADILFRRAKRRV